MTQEQKNEIKNISQKFASGMKIPINGSGWLIVDPLSAYLTMCGFPNKLKSIDATDNNPQVLIMVFKDGSQFIPAAKDLLPLHEAFKKNWMWI